ncbi:MAG: deoxyribodipyrimidine photo-lyase, partial [Acetobacterales bacterium]
MTEAAPAILWFRQDLRLADNPALNAATDGGRPTIPVFVLDDDTPGRWAAGGASRWWLHHSLTALADSLAAIGLPLMLRRGRAGSVIPALARETGAGAVFWNRCYEAQARGRDEAIKHVLKEQGVEARSFNGSLLHEPWTVATRHGDAYSVYTPFARACLQKGDPERPATPPREARRGEDIASDRLEDWALLPSRPDWAGGLRETW